MSQPERITMLNCHSVPAVPRVIYWMQASVRTRYNHALEYAVHLANHRQQPLQVVFCVTPTYPDANLRHFWFLLEGLQSVGMALRERGIPFTVWMGDPNRLSSAFAGGASTIVTDRGYLRHQREWYGNLAAGADCPVVQVESNVVVPVETASDKEEYSAATIRRKIDRLRERFLAPVPPVPYGAPGIEGVPLSPPKDSGFTPFDYKGISTPEVLASLLGIDSDVSPSPTFQGGEAAAIGRLGSFLEHRFTGYAAARNNPAADGLSGLSPYLHFGHISPLEIALEAIRYAELSQSPGLQEDLDTLLEELIVRRELAMNYAYYNSRYDTFDGLSRWAQKTLLEHSGDTRPALYDFETLENAGTDDPYWNACQREMVVSGKMHGYMRMYWGKKILEWSADPEEAFQTAVRLNDRYELDGRDPNGYAGVAWVFGKHDRPWVERPVFGTVRYMNANGLKRKFKEIDLYVSRWSG